MIRISLGLWLAVAGALASLVAVASDFYVVGVGTPNVTIQDAWIGLPHAADLVLASALTTTALVILAGVDRGPMRGRFIGAAVAAVGGIGLAQLIYRGIIPPFGGCLTYGDCGGAQSNVTLLTGYYIAIAGCAAAVIGGLAHMASQSARRTVAASWAAPRQAGATPLLWVAAAGSVLMIGLGFTVLPFYRNGFSAGPPKDWSAWIAIPKTADLLVLLAASVVFLVISAARRRAPLEPAALGAVIGVAGLLATIRIAFRIVDGPFIDSSHQPGTTFAGSITSSAEVHIWAYVALICAIAVFLSGVAQVVSFREHPAASGSDIDHPATPRSSART